MESGKWRNLEKLGKNKKNVSPKRQKRDGKEGSLLGRGGSESRKKKKPCRIFYYKSRFCRSHVPRKTRFLRADTKKKENETAATLVTKSVFFFSVQFLSTELFFIQFLSTELFLQSSLSGSVLPRDSRARESSRET